MNKNYDMNVDYDTLESVKRETIKIQRNLNESTTQMNIAFQQAQGYLSGYQFEQARDVIMRCIYSTSKAVNNLERADKYIEELEDILVQYVSCTYKGA